MGGCQPGASWLPAASASPQFGLSPLLAMRRELFRRRQLDHPSTSQTSPPFPKPSTNGAGYFNLFASSSTPSQKQWLPRLRRAGLPRPPRR
ncbi:hypothetical protein FJTKL_03931 [Diaporthe vaccinii]|uniref:Uncharacterized protein n=1 Tax=Diaporthe vaccinii TaxID=105482 RepID=A0ABR4F1K8_9PEZI